MGYTHYWKRPKELDALKFKSIVQDCQKICDALPIPLGDWEGKANPEFSEQCVSFNGSIDSLSMCRASISIPWPTDKAEGVSVIGDKEPKAGNWFAGDLLDSRCVDENGDGSYESFTIPRSFEPAEWQEPENGKHFSFCKTAFRPYDLNVQCCLIIFKEYLGDDFDVSSDGTSEQWNEARDACQHFVGFGLLFQLDDE